MANKCNSCGKFLALADTVKCVRCSFLFHRTCAVNKSPDSKAPKWICKSYIHVESEYRPFLEEIAHLKSELNDRDQSCLTNDVEITGITERAGENLPHILGLVACKIGVQIDEKDVVYVERSGPRPAHVENSERLRPRPIVVRLARRALREQLLRAARVRRGADSSSFEIDKEPKRFYINERLTRANRFLFFKAREEGHKNGWRYVWTRGGRIYARRSKETAAHRIRSEDDLMTVFGQTSI
ncbi:uncharacterized protein LOC124542787 [Vanessa cardui]|uniref:uncharacterized protein LOC124542787 n=1 Tax=Vanessa cardui TaxID=171605 RepID=UPI001F12A293|nr:uncharacterized protein LOC124542787 [Vanessa cardui]